MCFGFLLGHIRRFFLIVAGRRAWASPAFHSSKVFKSSSQEFSMTGLEPKAILPLTSPGCSPVPALVISSSIEAGHVFAGPHCHVQPHSRSPLCLHARTASHLPGHAAGPRQCSHSHSSPHGQLVQGQQNCRLMKSCQMLPGLAGPVGDPTVTMVDSKTRQELSISLGA